MIRAQISREIPGKTVDETRWAKRDIRRRLSTIRGGEIGRR